MNRTQDHPIALKLAAISFLLGMLFDLTLCVCPPAAKLPGTLAVGNPAVMQFNGLR